MLLCMLASFLALPRSLAADPLENLLVLVVSSFVCDVLLSFFFLLFLMKSVASFLSLLPVARLAIKYNRCLIHVPRVSRLLSRLLREMFTRLIATYELRYAWEAPATSKRWWGHRQGHYRSCSWDAFRCARGYVCTLVQKEPFSLDRWPGQAEERPWIIAKNSKIPTSSVEFVFMRSIPVVPLSLSRNDAPDRRKREQLFEYLIFWSVFFFLCLQRQREKNNPVHAERTRRWHIYIPARASLAQMFELFD